MSEIVAGLYLKGLVVVGHRAAQVVLVETGEGAVDIVAGDAGALKDGFVDLAFCLGILTALQADHGTHGPRLSIEVVEHKG